jgi:hypothetical protein
MYYFKYFLKRNDFLGKILRYHTPFFLFLFFSIHISCSQPKENMYEIFSNYEKADFFRSKVHDSIRHLIPTLDTILYRDQFYRSGKHKGPESKRQQAMRALDAINMKVVDSILQKHGFLSITDIGIMGHQALVSVMIHSSLDFKLKYTSLFEVWLKDKKIAPTNYAAIVDRLLVQQHRFQLYGTQVMVNKKTGDAELYPLCNPDSVEARRTKIGIAYQLSEYLSKYNLKWDLELYKRQLPQLVVSYKILDSISNSDKCNGVDPHVYPLL